MNTKQKIIESLEGKRTEIVWELIEKAVKEIYVGDGEIPENTKKEYLNSEEEINNPKNRYIIIEDYNIEDGFYHRFYEDTINLNGKIPFMNMFEDYFGDTQGGWQRVLLVDMKERKCYLLDKKVSYPVQKIKIK